MEIDTAIPLYLPPLSLTSLYLHWFYVDGVKIGTAI
jgi:hypothetical protein